MRHALGVLGVLAAGVLLAVSAAMNWRFGYQLGKTEFDGLIYGSASAAADCMKALVPFFFFAAWRNRVWSQAIASALVWVVVTAYSLTSALGHAALNRADTTGQRAVEAQSHKDLRSDLDRLKSQRGWVPQHRPLATVQAELDGVAHQRYWSWSNGCTQIKGAQSRAFCDKYTALKSEKGAAEEGLRLDALIAGVQAKLGKHEGVVHASADPQAAVLAALAGIILPGVKVEHVQTALTVFIALLLEIGSGLGMYIAFSQWRIHDRVAPRAPAMASVQTYAAPPLPAIEAPAEAVVATPAVAVPVAVAKPRIGANDNKSAPARIAGPPESDVERFRNERIETQEGSTVTVSELYEDYCTWCDEQQKEPLALPTFSREFQEMGIEKAKVAGRVRYMKIAIKASASAGEAKNTVTFGTRAA
ncbi:MAG: hypothetical protein R3D27_02635 [Hyphomicrobiaceae bacterium]